MDFFTRFTLEKTPQNNFSSENFSVENNYSFTLLSLLAWLSTQLSAQLSARLSAQLSDASQSDYLVSLSYPMALFSANLFELFLLEEAVLLLQYLFLPT